MKKVLAIIEVKELPGEDLDLSDAVADITLYPNIESADDYSTRIGRWFYAKVIPLPEGHGAIKDVSQIEIPMCEDRAYEKWVQVAINSAPTIIEADKGETE